MTKVRLGNGHRAINALATEKDWLALTLVHLDVDAFLGISLSCGHILTLGSHSHGHGFGSCLLVATHKMNFDTTRAASG